MRIPGIWLGEQWKWAGFSRAHTFSSWTKCGKWPSDALQS